MFTTSIAGRTWHFSHALGRPTAEHNGTTGGYGYPVDVAVGPDGMLFVLSRGMGRENEGYETDIYQRVGKTTLDEHHFGDFARREFTWATGIAVSQDGNVYCTDEFENEVKILPPDNIQTFPQFDPDGETIGSWGETGSGPGQLNGPSGIKFDADDNLYIADSKNDRVQKFTKDGRYLQGWGESGSGEGQFDRPWGLCLDSDGNVYVADWGNNRVQKFTEGGEFLMSFGGTVMEGTDLDHPAGVAVDSEGDVYISDWGNQRVQIYEADGSIITALYGDAVNLSKAAEYVLSRNGGIHMEAFLKEDDVMTRVKNFDRPVGLVVDDQDRLIVTDICGRLQVYRKDNDWVDPRP